MASGKKPRMAREKNHFNATIERKKHLVPIIEEKKPLYPTI